MYGSKDVVGVLCRGGDFSGVVVGIIFVGGSVVGDGVNVGDTNDVGVMAVDLA